MTDDLDRLTTLLATLGDHVEVIPEHRRTQALLLLERVLALVPSTIAEAPANSLPSLEVETAIPTAATQSTNSQPMVETRPTSKETTQ